jgi:outer membrane protein assembly factor BamD (BamD/ComL family)
VNKVSRKNSLRVVVALVTVAMLSGCGALGPSEEEQLSSACEWYNKGSEALGNGESTALEYFKKSAEGFQELSDVNPGLYADAYATATKWASGTNFADGDVEKAFALAALCGN